jgi:hypothetical protein
VPEAEAARHHRRLQLARSVGEWAGKIAGNRYQNVAAFWAMAPFAVLPDPSLQHLIGVEVCILAQNRPREGSDQTLDRMAERRVASYKVAGFIY